MGFLDRFKKEKTRENTQGRKTEPEFDMTLNYTSGTVANVTFLEGEYVDDKYLSKARIVYTTKEGNFTSKTVYIEPELVKGDDGLLYDNTKAYYTSMGQTPHTKGFFKEEFIDESLMGSDYIGRLDLTKEKPTRSYDNNFRAKYVAKFKEEKLRKARENEVLADRRQEEFEQNLIENTYSNGVYDASCKNFDDMVNQRIVASKREENER